MKYRLPNATEGKILVPFMASGMISDHPLAVLFRGGKTLWVLCRNIPVHHTHLTSTAYGGQNGTPKTGGWNFLQGDANTTHYLVHSGLINSIFVVNSGQALPSNFSLCPVYLLIVYLASWHVTTGISSMLPLHNQS